MSAEAILEAEDRELFEEEELERARNKYRAASYSITERSASLSKTQLMRKFYDLSTLEELEAQANQVTAEEIRDLANQLFDDTKKLTLICKEEEKNED